MNKTAIVCVTNDLSTDQRVHKTCLTLQKCGYFVIEYGRLLPDSQPLERPYFVERKKLIFHRGPLFYAEFNIRLFFYLLFSECDLIFANDLDTLPAAWLAAKIRGKKIIYDTHEYYTETPELVKRPSVQRIWKGFEDFLFPRIDNILTVNESIASLYSKKYNKKVRVSRNIPLSYTPERIKSRKELDLPENKKIIILQGAGINIQRGAEEAVEAMRYIDHCLLLMVGNGDVIPLLKKMVAELQLEEKVLFKQRMPFTELRQYTLNSDLGLAIDKNTNMNYQFSLPNKLFDYIHSGIPVLSSELVELKNIIEKYDLGYFIQSHEPKHIAGVINSIFGDEISYQQKKENTKKARMELCWEKEEEVLINMIKNL